ncbi:uncharacterized protein BP5553_06127 [Venustampulla echinocandica]|uniref:Heterokaryon incompatibility domain-containing protein n=1 Tax=Venustampulla echinocandica TaxID=2656787 RepID=A0A370TMM9_9HELO|nr:uncharacterized protein BP5553_06127 [Venustampulla echinocandica]RDL36775.1 hypothetical protein BP5553_06127 [Venustampulla echinocandica]
MPKPGAEKRSRPDDDSSDEHNKSLKRLRLAEEELQISRWDIGRESPAEATPARDPNNAAHPLGTAEACKAEYKYEPLDPSKNETRLLCILPIQDNQHQSETKMVHCTLSPASLDVPPVFEALSYTWGGDSNPSQIILDGKLFSVRSNLGTALQHLRYPSHTRIIWVDAICINQEDTKERSKQISKMRTIYQLASGVISWVSGPTTVTKLAFSLLDQLNERQRGEIGRDTRTIIHDPDNLLGWKAFLRFLHLPYWSRVWIIQELVMARTITIVCGEDKISCTHLIAIQKLLEVFKSDLKQLIPKDPIFRDTKRWTDTGPRNMTAGFENVLSDPPPLVDTIITHQNKDASDARDKIYALIGLTNARDSFEIDYDKSIREVYMDVVKYAHDTTGRLDIVFERPREAPKFQLPTWVPDWSSRFQLISRLHMVGNGSPAEVVFRLKEGIMDAKGFCFDKIAAISEESKTQYAFDDDVRYTILDFHAWRGFFRAKKGSASYSIEDDEAFCRTLVGNCFQNNPVKNSTSRSGYYHLIGAIARKSLIFHPNIELDEQLMEATHSCDDQWDHARRDAWSSMLVGWITTAVRKRRFIISSEGRTGLAQRTVNEGDMICIIRGFKRPVILRPRQEGGFIFLGEVYIDDGKKSSAEEELEAGKHKLEIFEIH